MVRASAAALTAALVLLGSSAAFAGATVSDASAPAQQSVLAPGHAAGVQKAEGWWTDNGVYVVGGAAVVVGVVLLTDNNGHHHHTSSTATAP
jgi:hypothetical protein